MDSLLGGTKDKIDKTILKRNGEDGLRKYLEDRGLSPEQIENNVSVARTMAALDKLQSQECPNEMTM